MLKKAKLISAVVVSAMLTACGGGSGGSSSSTPAQYTIGGTVTGLSNFKSLTLQNNGTGDLLISADGSFSFANPVSSGSAYSVGVSSQPIGMQCVVSNASGNATANVTNIAVTCSNRPGKFTYVANLYSDRVSAFLIDNASGNLTPISGSPFTTANRPISVATHPSGKFLYVAHSDAITPISAYTIDASTGSISLIATYDNSGAANYVTLDSQGRFLYLADSTGYVVAYAINQATGALTFVGSYTAGTTPTAVTVDPSSRYVYVYSQGSNDISAYSINSVTGALTWIANYVAGSGGYSLTIDQTGSYLYSASVRNGQNIQAYSINATTGVLSFIAGYGNSSYTDYVAINPTGEFLYNVDASNVLAYSRNQATGVLTLIGTYVTGGSGGNAIAIDPLNKYAYIPNKGSNYIGDVSVMIIDESTGALTASTPVASGDYNTSIAIAIEQ